MVSGLGSRRKRRKEARNVCTSSPSSLLSPPLPTTHGERSLEEGCGVIQNNNGCGHPKVPLDLSDDLCENIEFFHKVETAGRWPRESEHDYFLLDSQNFLLVNVPLLCFRLC